MRPRKCKISISLVLSPLIVIALFINAGTRPASASTLQSVFFPNDCPDSLVITGAQELGEFWEQFKRKLKEDNGGNSDLGSQSEKEGRFDDSQSVYERSNGKFDPEEDAVFKVPSIEEATVQEASASVPPPEEEQQGLWANLREFLSQISELRVEMPNLSLEEAKKIWDQIEGLRAEIPELSFEEAKEVWGQIRGLRVGIPDLSFEKAKEVWGQVRGLQEEMSELSFGKAQAVWYQIRSLQVEMPHLSFEEAQVVWGQINRLRVGMPDLSFEEAKKVWGQIRELQEVMPDLSFEEAQEAWGQIRELQEEMPDLNIGMAREVWAQIRSLHLEAPDLDFEEARKIWSEIQSLGAEAPDLSFEEAKATLVQIREVRVEMPTLSFEEANELWGQVQGLQVEMPDLSWVAAPYVERAEHLLSEQGFEDTDGDGHLNWPEDSPFVGGENLNIELVVTETSGVVISLIPIVGDTVDGVALLVGKDPYSGECLTKTEQIILALGIILLLPISVKSVKVIGKQLDKAQPLIRKILVNSLPNLPVSIRSVLLSNLVDDAFKGMRRVTGPGEITSMELAGKFGFQGFSTSNYRMSLRRFTGVSEDAVNGYEAHHLLPQTFEAKFLENGIDNISDPRLLVWVDKEAHQKLSPGYSEAWRTFFESNPNPPKTQILEEARELAEEYGYEVLFETS